MNTLEIYCKLLSIKKPDKIVIDVLSKDQLPGYNVKPPFTFCINFSNSDEEGSHWIAIFANATRIFFFCPYGFPIEFYGDEFLNFVKRFALPVNTNILRWQSPLSNCCGEFCILFLMSHIKKKCFLKLLSRTDLALNDKVVKSFVKKLNSKLVCFAEVKSICNQICKIYNKNR